MAAGSGAGMGAPVSELAVSGQPGHSGAPQPSFFAQLRIGMNDPRWLHNLAATAACWGLYDVAYYGSNQFTPTMTAKV